MTTTAITALGGTLTRDPATGTWSWRDGAPAEGVTDMRLEDLAPSFRCRTTRDGDRYRISAEIPRRWRSAGHWPRGVVDPDAATAIQKLLDEYGMPSRIYAEGLCELRDDHRLTRNGWRIPIEAWDAVMRRPCGAWWPMAVQEAILLRARDLGWGAP